MKVAAEDLWPLVMDFLEEYYSKEDFKAFKKYFKLKVDTEDDPYVEAGGMKAMLKCFIKNNKDLKKKLKQSKDKEEKQAKDKKEKKSKKRKREEDSENEPIQTKRPRLSSVASETSKGPMTRKKS